MGAIISYSYFIRQSARELDQEKENIMTARKMVSASKNFVLDGDNFPFLLLMTVSVLTTYIGAPLVAMRVPENAPVVWVLMGALTLFYAYVIRYVYRALRASKV